MKHLSINLATPKLLTPLPKDGKLLIQKLFSLLLVLGLLLGGGSDAWAARDTNSYDGNIFALYAGNGALVPPRISLAEAQAASRPVLLAFYLDDSAASKGFAPLLSDLQGRWGNVVELIALPSDPYQVDPKAPMGDPSHHWSGVVPQIVVLASDGTVLFNGQGLIEEADVELALAKATGLEVPKGREGSTRRNESFNEYNSEMVP